DFHVTGVQTCALPIFDRLESVDHQHAPWRPHGGHERRDQHDGQERILARARRVERPEDTVLLEAEVERRSAARSLEDKPERLGRVDLLEDFVRGLLDGADELLDRVRPQPLQRAVDPVQRFGARGDYLQLASLGVRALAGGLGLRRGLLQELLAPDLLAQLAGPRLELLDLGVDVRDLGRDLDRVEALELLAEPLDLRLESLDLALGVSLAAVMLLERGVRLGPDLLHP